MEADAKYIGIEIILVELFYWKIRLARRNVFSLSSRIFCQPKPRGVDEKGGKSIYLFLTQYVHELSVVESPSFDALCNTLADAKIEADRT